MRSEKLAVEDRIRLSCAASWVQHPATLFLPHNGRGFEVLVDPTQLPEGMSYTEVLGWESTAAWRGPLFRQDMSRGLLLCNQCTSASQAGADANCSACELCACR